MAAVAASAPLLLSRVLGIVPLLKDPCAILFTILLTLGFNALGGFTFARVANNHGTIPPACKKEHQRSTNRIAGYNGIKENAATGAAVVFGVIALVGNLCYVAVMYGIALSAEQRRERRRWRRLRSAYSGYNTFSGY
ncbi:hypothetical protein BKA66DRAFT_208739 [Pyrenochaeta sp. MPI-SDFR-AT-0127]|nr:hypothetical protein BKA66DRAFT_208739 [Pyrenochaeta sp. MPI-SDFR-AT-0127]